MQILFVFSLLFAVLVSIFAVMNSDVVTIKILWKQFQFSQAIVILGSAAVGAIIVALLGVLNKVKSSFKIRELSNKIRVLEKKIEDLNVEVKNEEIIDVKIPVQDQAEVVDNEEKKNEEMIASNQATSIDNNIVEENEYYNSEK